MRLYEVVAVSNRGRNVRVTFTEVKFSTDDNATSKVHFLDLMTVDLKGKPDLSYETCDILLGEVPVRVSCNCVCCKVEIIQTEESEFVKFALGRTVLLMIYSGPVPFLESKKLVFHGRVNGLYLHSPAMYEMILDLIGEGCIPPKYVESIFKYFRRRSMDADTLDYIATRSLSTLSFKDADVSRICLVCYNNKVFMIGDGFPANRINAKILLKAWEVAMEEIEKEGE